MADAQTTLEIILAATDQTGSGFTGVGNRISELSSATQDVTAPFADLAKGVLAVDAALIALTAGGLALAVKASGEFGNQFAEITTLFDASVEQIDTFRADVLLYSKDSTKSIEDINASVYTAISAGTKYTDSLGMVRIAEQLAVGGKAELNASTLLLASAMNAYGASAGEAGDYSDALFVTVKDGLTTIPELAASMARVTTDAVAAGVSFDVVTAAVATLTSKGIPTAEAVTYIAAALKGIIKPTKEAADEANRLDIQFNLAGLQSKGLAGFMADLQVKTGGSSESMNLLFGSTEAAKAALILAGSGAEKFTSTLEDMKNKAGATAAAYDKMAGEMEQVNQRLANNVEGVLIGVGDKVKGDYLGLVGSLTTILQSLGAAVESGALDGLFTIIETSLKEAEQYLDGIAKALPEALNGIDFSGFTGALEAAGGSISGLFGDLDLSKPEDLRQAIQKVIDSLASLTEFSGSMVEGFKPLISGILSIIENFNALDSETKGTIGEITGLMAVVSAVAIPLGAMGLALSGIGSLLGMVSGGVGIVTASIAGAGGLSAALAVVAASPLAIAALAAVVGKISYDVGTSLYNMTAEGKEYQANLAAIKAGQAENATGAQKLAASLAQVSNSTGMNITSMEQLNRLEKEGAIIYDTATNAWKQQKVAAEETGGAVTKMLDPLGLLKKSTNAAQEATGGWIETMVDGVRTFNQVDAAIGTVGVSADKTTKALDDVAKKSKEAEAKLLDLASNERIKAMEFSANINIAGIEADRDVILGMFDSINVGIEDTGKTWTSLWSMVGSVGGSAGAELEASIKREEDRRQSEFDQQKDLTALKIEETKQLIELRRNGGNVTKFEITGGSPTAQYLFTELFKEAQIYATGEGGAFLLGATS